MVTKENIMEYSFSDKNVVDFYIKAHKESFEKGIDKVYPNLSMVRIEGRYFDGPGKLLDYGCGFGSNLIHLLNRGHSVTAVDTSPYAIKMVEQKLTTFPGIKDKAKLEVIDPEKSELPYENNSFDYVVCASVLSLLTSKEKILTLLNEFKRIVRPGGKLFLDINGINSEFAIYSEKIEDETYIYKGRNGKADPMTVICPDNKESFAKLVSDVLNVEEVGITSHKFFEYAEEEYIVCALN